MLETAGGEGSFERVTLFEGREASGIGRRELVHQVRATLERLEPHVVCISGYGFRASLAALARLLAAAGIPVRVHALLDGRDTPPRSAEGFVRDFLSADEGGGNIEIATIGGFGRSRATRIAVEPELVQQIKAGRSSVSAIWRAANGPMPKQDAFTSRVSPSFVNSMQRWTQPVC